MKDANRHTGIVVTGMIIARKLPRNSRMTRPTSVVVAAMVTYTERIAARMNSESSLLLVSDMPSGRSALMRSISSSIPVITSTVLAVDCLMMPSDTELLPLVRNMARVWRGPSSTRATSPRRIR